uniref:Uncharacterized protein n=1 Tax=Anguilla anguilla TaxID=7936 RepID=A0A0E9SSM5_ANGAN
MVNVFQWAIVHDKPTNCLYAGRGYIGLANMKKWKCAIAVYSQDSLIKKVLISRNGRVVYLTFVTF